MISRALFITMIVLIIAVVALGIYGLHMKHQAELATPLGPEAKPVSAPVNGSTAIVALFVPNDLDGVLVRSDVSVSVPTDPSGRAREILRTLVTACQAKDSTHPLPPDADIKDVFLPSANLAIINANAAFADGHRSGVLVEELTIAAFARTLAVNMPDIKQFKLLIDGKERETLAGHADLLEIYSTDQQTWSQLLPQ
jgi:Sporulation and spore germination